MESRVRFIHRFFHLDSYLEVLLFMMSIAIGRMPFPANSISADLIPPMSTDLCVNVVDQHDVSWENRIAIRGLCNFEILPS